MSEYVPTAFENSLIDKSSPEPWNQLIALSRETINEGLKDLYEVTKAKDPMSTPVCHIDLKSRTSDAHLIANLNPSQVIPNVDYSGPADDPEKVPMLYFQWNFESGTLTLPADYVGTDTKIFDVRGWKVAFGTQVVSEQVSPKDPRYQEIFDRMGQPVGDFSILRLFFQVQGLNAPGKQVSYYTGASYFGGVDWTAENEAVRDAFTDLLKIWIYQMSHGWFSTLGFRLATSHPETIGFHLDASKPEVVTPTAPTFPPTSITYTTYPWLEPLSGISEGSNDSSANALCYLIMTKNRAPSTAKTLLPYTGTWVSTNNLVDPHRDAVLCMNVSQFWGEWLLPNMQMLNVGAHVQPLEPTLAKDGYSNCNIELNFEAGSCTAHQQASDPYFAFQQEKDKKGNLLPKWTWKSNDDLCHTHNQMTNHSMKWTLNQDSWASTSVTFARGGNTIEIDGEVKVHAMLNAKVALTSYGTAEMAATQPFKMVYRICGVDKGGLQVVRDPGEKYPEPDIDISGPSGVVRIGDWSKFCHAVIENLLSSMEMKMNVIDHAFLTNLKGANRLFLPGAGVFNFTRPLFNKRGDMVTNVAYMGVSVQVTGSGANSSTRLLHGVIKEIETAVEPPKPTKQRFICRSPRYTATVAEDEHADTANGI